MNGCKVLTEVTYDDLKDAQIFQKGWICSRCNTSVNPEEKICPMCNKIKEERFELSGKEILMG